VRASPYAQCDTSEAGGRRGAGASGGVRHPRAQCGGGRPAGVAEGIVKSRCHRARSGYSWYWRACRCC